MYWESLPSGTAKRHSQATLRNNSEESFIVWVERKMRARYKQFFLSCIAESVNKDQIYSYLNTRNITPNNISTFRSKRRGTISAKISIPAASSSDVLGVNFWPKHVRCKPWVQNEAWENLPCSRILIPQREIAQRMYDG
jgi:hypothetical protein